MRPFVSWLLLPAPQNPLFVFTHLLLHNSLYLLGPPFLNVVPLPQHPLRLDLCHMSWKAFPETHLPLLVLVTCPSRVSLVTLILTHLAAFMVGFQRLHTCDAKFCELLDSRDWVISIACKAQNQLTVGCVGGWIKSQIFGTSLGGPVVKT